MSMPALIRDPSRPPARDDAGRLNFEQPSQSRRHRGKPAASGKVAPCGGLGAPIDPKAIASETHLTAIRL